MPKVYENVIDSLDKKATQIGYKGAHKDQYVAEGLQKFQKDLFTKYMGEENFGQGKISGTLDKAREALLGTKNTDNSYGELPFP
jgi:hypothetical protein